MRPQFCRQSIALPYDNALAAVFAPLMPKSLTLIAPQIAPALAQAMLEGSSRWPQLARLSGRGSIRTLPAARGSLGVWQSALLEALGIHEPDQYPSAAVTRTGDVGERAGGYWLHLQPMHFVAGLDRLTAVLLRGSSRVARAELAELEPTIAAHLRPAGYSLMRTSLDDWLVRSDRTLDLLTCAPETAAANPLQEAMPQGRDAPALRRLMTELQMLLHEHPVSIARMRRGVPAINAVWFHGCGAIGDLNRYALPQAFGDDLYLRGIYRLNDSQVTAAPHDAEALLARLESRAVAVIAADDLDVLEAAWLAPLAHALAAGIISKLDIRLDRWHLAVTRQALLRFWRAERAPAQWAAC